MMIQYERTKQIYYPKVMNIMKGIAFKIKQILNCKILTVIASNK